MRSSWRSLRRGWGRIFGDQFGEFVEFLFGCIAEVCALDVCCLVCPFGDQFGEFVE